MSLPKTHVDLTWNPHPRENGRFISGGGRLEGTYQGVELKQNVVYQGDTSGGPYGRSLTPGVFTCTWMGVVDPEGWPLFRHVDDHSIIRRMIGLQWFDTLENIMREEGL
jgi:hypothetical protein